jgi:hypothetical protein
VRATEPGEGCESAEPGEGYEAAEPSEECSDCATASQALTAISPRHMPGGEPYPADLVLEMKTAGAKCRLCISQITNSTMLSRSFAG